MGINDRYVWITADGRRIPIKEMEDLHLINTINFLHRTGILLQLKYITSLYDLCSFLQGEMAIYEVERQIWKVEAETLEDFLIDNVPQYQYLISEAKRRKLIYKSTEEYENGFDRRVK